MTLITFTRHLRSILRRKEIHLQSVTAPKQIINKFLNNTIHYPGNVSRYCTNTGDLKYHEIPVERIRNFGIIAHVDHGKSTLADRLLEITGTVKKVASAQLLDSLQVERERGITVKAQTCSLLYEYNGETYLLNLIDTPGHVDFSNEVARSLSICDGVLLLVDANQGVQAQTVANYYLAKNKKLEIVPVVNKIDLPRAQPDAVCQQMKTVFNINPASVLKISAKMGIGIDDVLTSIVEEITPPDVDRSKPFRSLLFDSTYDKYRGVLNMIFVKEGTVAVGDHVTFHHTGKSYEIRSLSLLRPEETPVQLLKAGQVGLLACNMRSSAESIAGDTIHLKTNTSAEALPGFQAPQPIVFAGIYPAQSSEFLALRGAIDKLCLNDSGVSVTPDSSAALGRGWRAGFLGLLHLDVFCQRLQQEFDAEPIITAPSVTYQIDMKPRQKTKAKGGGFEDAETVFISNAAHWPDPIQVEEFYEPFVNATIITPTEAIGSIIALCVERRGLQSSASINVDAERVMLTYQLPLAEIIHDFHDRIKAMSSGYASFNYIDAGFRSAPLVKIDILLNGVPCVELSRIVHAMKATSVARQVAALCAELIPRQMIQINVQACVGAKILARETIKPYRKDVTAKLYGGDVTRRMKLLRNQAEGKKKMRSLANVKVPHDTFINILKR